LIPSCKNYKTGILHYLHDHCEIHQVHDIIKQLKQDNVKGDNIIEIIDSLQQFLNSPLKENIDLDKMGEVFQNFFKDNTIDLKTEVEES